MTATSLLPAFIEADEALEFLYIAIRDRYNRFSVREAMSRIRPIFNSADEEIRYKIVTDLTAMKFAGVVPFLTDVLRNDQSPLIRHEAAVALAEIGGEDAIPVLEAATTDSDPSIAASARFAIQSILLYIHQGLRAVNE